MGMFIYGMDRAKPLKHINKIYMLEIIEREHLICYIKCMIWKYKPLAK